jgi:hypothetical protein
MLRHLSGLAALAVLAAAAGYCVSAAHAAASPTAQVMFLEDPSRHRGPDILTLLKDTDCGSIFGAKELGHLHMAWGNTKAPVDIPAEAPVLLHAHTRVTLGAYLTHTCQNTVRFTPEPGHLYDVTHTTTEKGACTLEIKDRATGQTPASYKELPKNCGKPED